jgi:preprotein translocase subunit SecA
MALNFLLSSSERFSFIQFGIGNGKTLLSCLVSILLAKSKGKSVFILSKMDHLILRDAKKFENLIRSSGLDTNVNSSSLEVGVYFYSIKKFTQEL